MPNNEEIIAQLAEIFSQPSEDVSELREELAQVNQQVMALKAEDQGWMALFGGGIDDDEGLELTSLKDWSKILRESVAGSPLPKQANALRYSYTFSEPFIIPGLTESMEEKPKPGRKPSLPKLGQFYSDPVNERYVFGKEAQELISTACSTDSMYIAVGDDKTRQIRPIPLSEIVAVNVDEDFPGEVIAYQRQWGHDKKNNNQPFQRWYYTDQFTGKRQDRLENGTGDSPETIPVDKTKTIIDFRVNQQVGWTFGTPDLMAGHIWNRKYISMMNHGEEVSATLAFFAAKVKNQSKKGAQNVGVKMGGAKKAGNTVSYGEGNEIDVFSTAGKTYDFNGLNPVAGMYGLSVGVSLVDLLSNPSASGSSYGAAKALDPATRRGIESRRSQIAGWLERVLKWGTGENIKVTPASIDDVDPYREMQMLNLLWLTGLAHEDEVRARMLYLTGVTSMHPEGSPEGVMLPNNEKSLPRKDIDTDSSAPTGDGPSTGAIGQGQSDGTGGAGSTAANDNRTDTIS